MMELPYDPARHTFRSLPTRATFPKSPRLVYTPGELKPSDALIIRDITVSTFTAIAGAKGNDEQMEVAAEWMSEAQVVIWNEDLWAASQRGREAFSGSRQEFPPQIWIHNGRSGFSRVGDPRLPLDVLLVLPNYDDCMAIGLHLPERRDGLKCWENEEEVTPISQPFPPFHRGEVADVYQAIFAGLAFMDLEWVGKERASFNRDLRRQAELKRRPPLPEVNTVVLRRTFREDRPTHGVKPEPRDWSCSWTVQAHWRKLPYPRKKDGATVTYIAPYLKGDPTKPLREPKGTVYVVKR